MLPLPVLTEQEVGGLRGKKEKGGKLPDKTGSCGKLYRRCVGRMSQMFKENQANEKVNTQQGISAANYPGGMVPGKTV